MLQCPAHHNSDLVSLLSTENILKVIHCKTRCNTQSCEMLAVMTAHHLAARDVCSLAEAAAMEVNAVAGCVTGESEVGALEAPGAGSVCTAMLLMLGHVDADAAVPIGISSTHNKYKTTNVTLAGTSNCPTTQAAPISTGMTASTNEPAGAKAGHTAFNQLPQASQLLQAD